MKFKYIGNHESISQFGFTFPRNVPVDVGGAVLTINRGAGKNKHTISVMVADKLIGNPHFEQVVEVVQAAKEEELVKEYIGAAKKKPGRPKGALNGGYKGGSSDKSSSAS
jgi:hypothetical protein